MKLTIAPVILVAVVAVGLRAQEPPWDASRVKPCDRQCLVDISDRYLDAMMKKDPAGLPLEPETRITENTATVGIGEGVLWRAKVEPTAFRIHVADPVWGQV